MSKNNLRLDLCLPSILLMPSCNGKYRIRQKAWMPAFLLEKRQENDHYSKLNLKLNREQVAQLKLRTQLLGSSAESLHDDSLCKVRQMFADLLGQIHCILSRCLKSRNKTISWYQQLQAETRSCSINCNVMIQLQMADNFWAWEKASCLKPSKQLLWTGLEPAAAAATLLPRRIGGDRCAVLDAPNLHIETCFINQCSFISALSPIIHVRTA